MTNATTTITTGMSYAAFQRAVAEHYRAGYHFFDFPAMLDACKITEEEWRDAMNLIEQHEIEMGECRVQRDDWRDKLEGTLVCYRPERSKYARTEIHFEKEGLRYMYCNMPLCDDYTRSFGYHNKALSICIHKIAALYFLGVHLIQKNPGDATTIGGNRLLEISGGSVQTSEPETTVDDSGALNLVPQLKVAQGQLALSFRVGGKKLYKVRSLPDFIETAEQGEAMKAGKSSEIVLHPSRFHGQSKVYYDMISNFVHQQRIVDEYRYSKAPGSFRGTTTGDALLLAGGELDRVFELIKEAPMEFLGATKKKFLVHGEEGRIRITLRMEHQYDETGNYEGVNLFGQVPSVYPGEHFAYALSQDALIRISLEEYQDIAPLLGLATPTGMLDVTIGRNHLDAFYYETLPWLRKRVSVEGDLTPVEDILPEEVHLTFYLDADYGQASCSVVARYGETQIPLIEEQQRRSGPKAMPEGRNSHRNQEKERAALMAVAKYFPFEGAAELRDEEADESGGERVANSGNISGDMDGASVFSTGEHDGNLYRLLEEGVDQLLELGEVQMTDGFRNLRVRRKPRITMGVAMENNLLDLKIIGEDIDASEMSKILSQYKRKKTFYRLRNGDFLKLEEESFRTLDEMMEALHLTPKELASGAATIPAYRALYVDKLLSERENIYARRDRSFKSIIKDFKTIKDADYDVPESLESTLRSYQKTGYRWMRTLAEHHFGGILADDMGLGKTLQVITLLLATKEELTVGTHAENATMDGRVAKASENLEKAAESSTTHALVVAPASLVFQWKEEIARFAPELTVAVISGTAAERKKQLQHQAETGDADVLLTSYDLLKRDIANYNPLSFRYEIIDEAQYIKNQTTAAAKAVKLVNAGVRFALTGTPIENRLSELWSIFDYLMPGALYGPDVFRKSFEAPIVKKNDEHAREQLSRMIAPFILRRCKQDVLQDLPEKMEEVRYAELTGEQQRLYDAQVLKLKRSLESSNDARFREERFAVLAELTRIRQICCEPGLCYGDYKGESAKREACMDLVQSAIDGGHRMLIFSQFTSMLDLLAADLDRAHIPYYTIVGSTPKERRLELVQNFNENAVPVFLISLKAGGFGLNLTGADMVIHYDPWWNVAAQNQATDRTHRIGQTQTVTVYKLIAKGTIEESILQMQEQKAKLAEDILAADGVSNAAISRDDLMALLEG